MHVQRAGTKKRPWARARPRSESDSTLCQADRGTPRQGNPALPPLGRILFAETLRILSSMNLYLLANTTIISIFAQVSNATSSPVFARHDAIVHPKRREGIRSLIADRTPASTTASAASTNQVSDHERPPATELAPAMSSLAFSRHSSSTGSRDHPDRQGQPQRHQDQVVQVSQNRDKIRDQIDRTQRIAHHTQSQNPRVPRRARIPIRPGKPSRSPA